METLRSAFHVVCFLVVLEVLSLCCFGVTFDLIVHREDWSENTKADVKKQGNEIVVAIERYQKDKGMLPGELTDLVPAYLPEKPGPLPDTEGWSFESSRMEFDLFCFSSRQLELVRYNSNEKRWHHKINRPPW